MNDESDIRSYFIVHRSDFIVDAIMSWKSDLNYGLAAFGIQIPERLDLDAHLPRLTDPPAHSTAKIVAASGVLFYIFERGHNPKVKDVWDAMIYTSTCLSVGYGDIFAKTPLGKILGTMLMTYGPALSGKALDGPAKLDPTQQQILQTLQEILKKIDSVPAIEAVK